MQMNEEDDQLPLSRMITITRASFWIYFTGCIVLFVCSLFVMQRPMTDWLVPSAIAICIFVDLGLEIIRQKQNTGPFLYVCYGFEAITTVVFAIIVIGKLLFP